MVAEVKTEATDRSQDYPFGINKVIQDEAVDKSQICSMCGRELSESEFWDHVMVRHGLVAEEYLGIVARLNQVKSNKSSGNVGNQEQGRLRLHLLARGE